MFLRRETGSVMLAAPREAVYQLLREQVVGPGAVTETANERLEVEDAGARSTFVLRDLPDGGTRLIHARAVPGIRGLLGTPERLREDVEADLFRIQRLASHLRR